MPIYTNRGQQGNMFGVKVNSLLKSSRNVTIASGYTSLDALRMHRTELSRIANEGGEVDLLLGMAIYDGLAESTYNELLEIHQEIKEIDSHLGGVRIVCKPNRFHGKIYRIEGKRGTVYLAGSSNFSHTGLEDNLEFNIQLRDAVTKAETDEYLSWLFSEPQSKEITEFVNFPIVEKARNLSTLSESLTQTIPSKTDEFIDIPLRVDEQPKSGLNAYFGKGRISKSSSREIARDWFEIEIIVDKNTRGLDLYPRGRFRVVTCDGIVIKCETQGADYKNLRSQSDLKKLGLWIKGKLQNSGALGHFEVVTSETLKSYGRDFIRLYRIKDSEYLMDF